MLAYLTLTIPLGPGELLIEGSVYFSLSLPDGVERFGEWFPAGVATPFGVFLTPERYPIQRAPLVIDEEIRHLYQWEALGPAYPLAYLLTWGEPFEPYNTRDWSDWSYDLSRMWQPDKRRCPQWRWVVGERSQFLPCYRL